MPSITPDLIVAILSLVAGVGWSIARPTIEPLIYKLLGRTPPKESDLSFTEKLDLRFQNLFKASEEVDKVLKELTEVAHHREQAIQKLQLELEKLEVAEKEQAERVNTLKNVPLPAVEHLLREMEPGEKRSRRRDYFLFGLGVVTSAVVSIVLSWFGVGS